MLRYIPVVCVALGCMAANADELPKSVNWEEHHNLFATIGVNAYTNNSVHYNVADIIRDHESIRDDNLGYNLSVGYDWDWITGAVALTRARVDTADAVAITGRVTMPIFPLENLPYIGVEYGMVTAEYSDDEYDIHVHDTSTTFGMIVGIRFEITDSFFIDALWQSNRFKMHTDVLDVPIKFHVYRQNIALAIGWRF